MLSEPILLLEALFPHREWKQLDSCRSIYDSLRKEAERQPHRGLGNPSVVKILKQARDSWLWERPGCLQRHQSRQKQNSAIRSQSIYEANGRVKMLSTQGQAGRVLSDPVMSAPRGWSCGTNLKSPEAQRVTSSQTQPLLTDHPLYCWALRSSGAQASRENVLCLIVRLFPMDSKPSHRTLLTAW